MSCFTRGMRRLAILAGVIGLAVGSAIAYFQFAELVRIRAQHDRFQALMATPALRHFAQTVANVHRALTSGSGDIFSRVGAAVGLEKAQGVDDHPDHKGNLVFEAAFAFLLPDGFSDWSAKDRQVWFEEHLVRMPVDWQDIDQVIADPNRKIVSIRMRTDEVLRDTPTPSAAQYSRALAFAPLGFLIPWGFVRLLAWTIAGFLRPADEGDPQ